MIDKLSHHCIAHPFPENIGVTALTIQNEVQDLLCRITEHGQGSRDWDRGETVRLLGPTSA